LTKCPPFVPFFVRPLAFFTLTKLHPTVNFHPKSVLFFADASVLQMLRIFGSTLNPPIREHRATTAILFFFPLSVVKSEFALSYCLGSKLRVPDRVPHCHCYWRMASATFDLPLVRRTRPFFLFPLPRKLPSFLCSLLRPAFPAYAHRVLCYLFSMPVV